MTQCLFVYSNTFPFWAQGASDYHTTLTYKPNEMRLTRLQGFMHRKGKNLVFPPMRELFQKKKKKITNIQNYVINNLTLSFLSLWCRCMWSDLTPSIPTWGRVCSPGTSTGECWLRDHLSSVLWRRPGLLQRLTPVTRWVWSWDHHVIVTWHGIAIGLFVLEELIFWSMYSEPSLYPNPFNPKPH